MFEIYGVTITYYENDMPLIEEASGKSLKTAINNALLKGISVDSVASVDVAEVLSGRKYALSENEFQKLLMKNSIVR